MEVDFTPKEKTAIANVLYNLVYADYNHRVGEDECLKACLDEMEFNSQDFVPIPKYELASKAYETLRQMDKEKKRSFSRMMTQISRADGHFGAREQAFVKEILVMCDIPFVHK